MVLSLFVVFVTNNNAFTVGRPLSQSPLMFIRGLPPSKTWRTCVRADQSRSVLECGCPLPLFARFATMLPLSRRRSPLALQFPFNRKYFAPPETTFVYGLTADAIFVNGPLADGPACSAKPGSAQLSTRLFPIRCHRSAIGARLFVPVTAANDSPTFKSSTR